MLSVLLRYTDSDNPFGIVKLFLRTVLLYHYTNLTWWKVALNTIKQTNKQPNLSLEDESSIPFIPWITLYLQRITFVFIFTYMLSFSDFTIHVLIDITLSVFKLINNHFLFSVILKHWVNSILSYCADDEDILPIIMFCATHSDDFNQVWLLIITIVILPRPAAVLCEILPFIVT